MLDCINHVTRIWDNNVTQTIIKNCFAKAGFKDEHFDEADNLTLNQFLKFEQQFEHLRIISKEPIDEDFDDFIGFDNLATNDFLTDSDIVENLQPSVEDNEEETVDLPNPDERSSVKVLRPVAKENLNTLRTFFMQNEDVPVHFFNTMNTMEEFMK